MENIGNIKIIFIIYLLLNNFISGQSIDSVKVEHTSRAAIIVYETGAGILGGVIAIIPTALLLNALGQPSNVYDGFALTAISIPIGFSLGASFGVYLVDKHYNKNSSYLTALGGAVVGSGIGFYLLTREKIVKGPEAVFGIVAPIICSIVSVNIFNFEDINKDINVSYSPIIKQGSLQHRMTFRLAL